MLLHNSFFSHPEAFLRIHYQHVKVHFAPDDMRRRVKTHHGLAGLFCGLKMWVERLCAPHLRAAGGSGTAECDFVEMQMLHNK